MFEEWGFDDMPALIPREEVLVAITEPAETEELVPDVADFVANLKFIGHCLSGAPAGQVLAEYPEETGRYSPISGGESKGLPTMPPLAMGLSVTPPPSTVEVPTTSRGCTVEDGPVFPQILTWRILTPPALKSILKGRSVYLKMRDRPFSSFSKEESDDDELARRPTRPVVDHRVEV